VSKVEGVRRNTVFKYQKDEEWSHDFPPISFKEDGMRGGGISSEDELPVMVDVPHKQCEDRIISVLEHERHEWRSILQ